MEHQFTVSQLARHAAPDANEAEIARITRQLRHWTLAGALNTLGVVYTGAGRHRKYSGDAVYVAALIIELAGLGLPIGVLNLIALGISRVLHPSKVGRGRVPLPDDGQADLWRRAIEGDGTIHLTCSMRFDVKGAHSAGLALYEADVPDPPSPITIGHVSAVVVDLTKLFEPLRAQSVLER